MIETKGLQRANYVQCLFVIGKVIEIYTQKVLCQLPGGKLDVYEAKHLNYIPLTPEWLQRFGFINNHSDNKGTRWAIYVGNTAAIFTIHINDKATFVKYYPDGFDNDAYWMPVKAEYIHQLQNLYFALTGEELTIKEPT